MEVRCEAEADLCCGVIRQLLASLGMCSNNRNWRVLFSVFFEGVRSPDGP